MGNFAENLNLGNRFRPPPPLLTALKERSSYGHKFVDFHFHSRDLHVYFNK